MAINVNTEPVAIANAVAALFEAIVIVAISFGASLTPEQVGAVSFAIIAVGQTAATIFGRSRVSPVE